MVVISYYLLTFLHRRLVAPYALSVFIYFVFWVSTKSNVIIFDQESRKKISTSIITNAYNMTIYFIMILIL